MEARLAAHRADPESVRAVGRDEEATAFRPENMSWRVVVRPEVGADAWPEAAAWYYSQRAGLGEEFREVK